MRYTPKFFFTFIHRVVDTLKKSFNISWMRVRMSYHIFNDLSKLLNGDLATKIGWVILSIELIDIECNCYLKSKFNIECVYKGMPQKKYLIYEVK